MNNKTIEITKKPFVRNVAIVASGTAAAQLVTMAFSPIITRIYGPEAFGILGVFMSMVGIIAPIAALTFPVAIVLPKSDEEAKGLIRLSLYTSTIMSILLTIILIFYSGYIVKVFQIEAIAPFLYLIPLVILFSAILEVIQQWLIRAKQFKITAKATFLNALVLNSAKVGIGLFNPVAAVLVVLTTLGSLFHALLMVMHIKRPYRMIEQQKVIQLKELIKRYKDFPLYRAPQAFINAISQSLPVLLLASLFGPVSAGFYTLSKTILGKPTQLIGKSVGDVFYPRIAEAANNGENLTRLIVKATLALAAVGIIPFGLVILFGPWIFGIIFGEEWVMAGEYARWIAIWSFFGFINRPSAKAIPVLKLQGSFLIYEIISAVIRAGVLFLGFYLYKSDMYAVIFFSLAGAILNLYLVIFTILKSRKLKVSR